MYFEGDCSLNSACEDPNQNVFSCCVDGQCLGESPFLWVIEETCQGGTIFDGPCSQNEECNRGSCCLPDGGCIDSFLTNQFIINCQAQGGFTSDGACKDTCGSSYACCLPDGTCQGGILNAASSAACAANGKKHSLLLVVSFFPLFERGADIQKQVCVTYNDDVVVMYRLLIAGGTLLADQSCTDTECPVDDNLISCCINGQCEFEGPPNVGLEIECNAAGGFLLTGPCVEVRWQEENPTTRVQHAHICLYLMFLSPFLPTRTNALVFLPAASWMEHALTAQTTRSKPSAHLVAAFCRREAAAKTNVQLRLHR